MPRAFTVFLSVLGLLLWIAGPLTSLVYSRPSPGGWPETGRGQGRMSDQYRHTLCVQYRAIQLTCTHMHTHTHFIYTLYVLVCLMWQVHFTHMQEMTVCVLVTLI